MDISLKRSPRIRNNELVPKEKTTNDELKLMWKINIAKPVCLYILSEGIIYLMVSICVTKIAFSSLVLFRIFIGQLFLLLKCPRLHSPNAVHPPPPTHTHRH